jgi:N-acetylglucosaminyl-diphospho-decaprenol L-rhamnosyltransferase
MLDPRLHISVVSHGQASFVEPLLADIAARVRSVTLRITVTENIPEHLNVDSATLPFSLHVTRNRRAQGFAANHNQAFKHEPEPRSDYFCVLNPDVRLIEDPFPALIECLADPMIGAVAPLVLNPQGNVEDNCRRFPTPLSIFRKAVGTDTTLYVGSEERLNPDWIAGMFMLFTRKSFEDAGGFDQRFHLYYEDVDLCARLRLTGYRIALCPATTVVHDARRESHRSLRYIGWHITSMLRFFCSPPYRRIVQQRGIGRI